MKLPIAFINLDRVRAAIGVIFNSSLPHRRTDAESSSKLLNCHPDLPNAGAIAKYETHSASLRLCGKEDLVRRRVQSRWWTLAFILAGAIGVAQAGTVGRVDLDTLKTPIYQADGDSIVRHNGDRFSNRPLYCNQVLAVVLGGDKPYLMLGGGSACNGMHMVALVREGKAKWLFDASDITSKYRADRMEWIVRDATWGDTEFNLQAVPSANGSGMGIRLQVSHTQKGDQLVWASGGAAHTRESFLYHYDMTTIGREALLKRGFVPGDCKGNVVSVDGGKWTLTPPPGKGSVVTTGECSVAEGLVVADASVWKEPTTLVSHPGDQLPMVCGTIALDQHPEIYWSVRTQDGDSGKGSPKAEFDAGMKRAKSIEQQVVVNTPDAWLDAGVAASCAVMDGVFRKGMYTHSGMRWSTPLLGWRTTFGPSAYGWHDRVKTEGLTCMGRQITQSDKKEPEANPTAGLASQSNNSRMFGVGRVNLYQPAHYDMQSQFFDQQIFGWKYTADAELENALRPALDLHLQYVNDCFDPADLGIYESYANTWPTDDQWYNGGGTSEETAYVYQAESAALEMAQIANDAKAIARHQTAIDKIRKAFFNLLWNPKTGHPGAYREQGGLKRLHDSCWLYSIFCPIDAGLLTNEQAATSLHYTESELERMKMPYGGEQCWPSNWVPSIWSLREMWPGDDYQLALAYFQTGFSDQGWSLLQGTFKEGMFFGPVPGDLGHPAGGTDFNDCASMFCRTVVEGLFGYRPDYPAGKVVIAPQFPTGWDQASIKTPDVGVTYFRHGGVSSCEVSLTTAAQLTVELPVSTSNVIAVKVDGTSAEFDVVPAFGQSIVHVQLGSVKHARVVVECADNLGYSNQEELNVRSGDKAVLKVAGGKVVDFHDPQGALSGSAIDDGCLVGLVSENVGNPLVFALVQIGQTRQWRTFSLHISNPSISAAEMANGVVDIPAGSEWQTIDLKEAENADVRTIFQQRYLSPRPNTCSLRLATDGYSTWQMVLDPKNKPPEIGLENVASLSDGKQNVTTKKGVPFLEPAEGKNIAFTSQWDNFPHSVEVPVGKAGDAVWLLVCGSTNPMEVGIANAKIQLNYADATTDSIDLVPPKNFWSLCRFGNVDYDYHRDGFCLPKVQPEILQLGNNCRAIVLNRRLKAGKVLKSVTLETLSQQVVIGLMGVTIMNPKQ